MQTTVTTDWKHTRKALEEFAEILLCTRCGQRPDTPMRYCICGHVVCSECSFIGSECAKCRTPFQPNEIQADRTTASLLKRCDETAEIIGHHQLWQNVVKSFTNPIVKTTVQNLRTTFQNKRTGNLTKNIKDINKTNKYGETLLQCACKKKDKEIVKHYLNAGANPNTKDNSNWTPLQETANWGFYDICKLLLEAGASPNIPGHQNRTALHDAVMENNLTVAELLLEYHAHSNVFDAYGKRPIDYCKSTEMSDLFAELKDTDNTSEVSEDLIRTSNQTLPIQTTYIVYAVNLTSTHTELLEYAASKHNMQVVHTFSSSVTHVVVEVNEPTSRYITYDILLAILHGIWILNSQWINLCAEYNQISDIELEMFAITGAAIKAQESAKKQYPRLFDKCHFYFDIHANRAYQVDNLTLRKDDLIKLIEVGGGKYLPRKPDPEAVQNAQFIPFHTAHDLNHPLYKCTHYIIYVPGPDEPPIKYRMPHIKSLPLVWLIECIERFTLIDPSHMGL